MTDNHSTDTGQISVAELLARNGQKVGNRSGGRRRRGGTGGISVAELTGEIPITPAAPRRARPDDDIAPEAEADAGDSGSARPAAPGTPATPQVTPVVPVTPRVEPVVPETPQVEPVLPETPKVEAPVLDTPAPPVAPGSRGADVRGAGPVVTDDDPDESAAEQTRVTAPADRVAPAPDGVKIESPTEIIRPAALPRRARAHLDAVATVAPAAPRRADTPEPRLLSGPASDLRGTGSDEDEESSTETVGAQDERPGATDPAAGGSKGAGRDARRAQKRKKRAAAVPADSGAAVPDGAGPAANRDDDAEQGGTGTGGKTRAETAPGEGGDDSADDTGSAARSATGIKGWALLIAESAAAIVAGGLLFKGFEKLWDMMPWVAFGLALVVIVGLVALVRVLRRTDDITSQLIALAVGAFVAFGPLLFLLPNG